MHDDDVFSSTMIIIEGVVLVTGAHRWRCRPVSLSWTTWSIFAPHHVCTVLRRPPICHREAAHIHQLEHSPLAVSTRGRLHHRYHLHHLHEHYNRILALQNGTRYRLLMGHESCMYQHWQPEYAMTSGKTLL